MRIAIVGAGPSGSYAAELLAKQGHDVHVFEDHPEVGVPVQCTGIVTHGLWELIPKEPSIIRTELNKVAIHGPNSDTVADLHEFVLDRAGLDKHLAKRAQSAGATYHLSHKFIGFSGKQLKFQHASKETLFAADITIGADGPTSEVAKAAGIWTPRKVWGGIQATIEGNYRPNTFEVFFGDTYKNFFGWVVPESANVARIGIAAQHKARDMFKAITKRYPGKILGWQSGPIPVYDKRIPVQNKERTVFLVGDAAGLVKATTGGGIITGMRSAQILASSISSKTDYAKNLKPLRRDLWLNWLIRRMLNTFTEKDYDRLISIMKNPKIHQIMKTHPRDYPSRFLTKMLFVEPRLLLFAKSFIKQLGLPNTGVENG